MATGKIKITSMAYIIFLLDSADLERIITWPAMNYNVSQKSTNLSPQDS